MARRKQRLAGAAVNRYEAEPSGFGDGWMVVQYPLDAVVSYASSRDEAEQDAEQRNRR